MGEAVRLRVTVRNEEVEAIRESNATGLENAGVMP
jgi:hypothetical protein